MAARDGYWTCRINGQLWLMYKEYKVGPLAETWQQLEAHLVSKGLRPAPPLPPVDYPCPVVQ